MTQRRDDSHERLVLEQRIEHARSNLSGRVAQLEQRARALVDQTRTAARAMAWVTLGVSAVLAGVLLRALLSRERASVGTDSPAPSHLTNAARAFAFAFAGWIFAKSRQRRQLLLGSRTSS